MAAGQDKVRPQTVSALNNVSIGSDRPYPLTGFLTQMLVFETTFLTLAFANVFGYAILASRARRLTSNPTAIPWFNRAGGTLLIGAGLAAAKAANN